MEYVIKLIQLILSLSILVLIHEFGHFFFARLFKTRVDKFYLFFNPWFSLFKYKKGDTEYGIGWLPLGGFCKISGMIDESLDRNQMRSEPQPWEYRSKKIYQRFLIVFGGVLFNFILALGIYSAILFTWGETYLPVKNTTYGIYCDSLALNAGLKNGDKIIKVGSITPQTYGDVMLHIVVDGARTMSVERDGKLVQVTIPDETVKQLIATRTASFIAPFVPFLIDSVLPHTPAQYAGLKKNDKIVAIDDVETPAYYDCAAKIRTLGGQTVRLTLERDGKREIHKATVSMQGTIGVAVVSPYKLFKLETKSYSFFESIPAGISLGIETLGGYVKQMKLLFTPEGASQIGGFGSIAGMFPELWDWESFWRLTAFLSIVLAFMNVLPIPALDGGHILFLIYEAIMRRKPSDKFLEYAQITGMILLFSLLIFANGNDLIRAIAGFIHLF